MREEREENTRVEIAWPGQGFDGIIDCGEVVYNINETKHP